MKIRAKELTARAQATPLLVGAKGSPLELMLNSLYFESDTPPEWGTLRSIVSAVRWTASLIRGIEKGRVHCGNGYKVLRVPGRKWRWARSLTLDRRLACSVTPRRKARELNPKGTFSRHSEDASDLTR